jgi:serine/threonine protein kinase
VLLDGDGVAKLADFGTARERDSDGGTHLSTRVIVGTLGYKVREPLESRREPLEIR